MTRFLSDDEARAYGESDSEALVPPGNYPVKVTSIEPKRSNPNVKTVRMSISSGAHRDRKLLAWVNTSPNLIWSLKKFLGDVVVDPDSYAL